MIGFQSSESSAIQHDVQNHWHGFAIRAHGTILFLTFSFFIPLAVLLIRTRATRSFVFHWIFQLTATVSSMGAMLIMFFHAWEAIKVIKLSYSSS